MIIDSSLEPFQSRSSNVQSQQNHRVRGAVSNGKYISSGNGQLTCSFYRLMIILWVQNVFSSVMEHFRMTVINFSLEYFRFRVQLSRTRLSSTQLLWVRLSGSKSCERASWETRQLTYSYTSLFRSLTRTTIRWVSECGFSIMIHFYALQSPRLLPIFRITLSRFKWVPMTLIPMVRT